MKDDWKNREHLVAQVVKNLSTVQETWVWNLGGEDPPEKGEYWNGFPVFLSGESHGQRSLVGYSLWGSQRVRHDWATFTLEWKQFIYVKTHILHWHTNLCVDFWFFILAVLKSLRVQMWMRDYIYSSYLQKTSEYRSQKRAFSSINELILVSLFIVSYFYLTYLDQLPICTTPIVNTGNI